jgi:hypothetical protein
VTGRLRHRAVALALAVLCVALSGVLAAAAGGTSRYTGKTSQGYPIHVTADRQHAELIRVKVKLRCRDGGLLFDDLSDFEPADLRPNGRFDDLQFGRTDEVHWQGRLNGPRVRGSIRVKDRLKNGVRCDSGNVRFAVRKPK